MFERARVSAVVMTNDPFDPAEARALAARDARPTRASKPRCASIRC